MQPVGRLGRRQHVGGGRDDLACAVVFTVTQEGECERPGERALRGHVVLALRDPARRQRFLAQRRIVDRGERRPAQRRRQRPAANRVDVVPDRRDDLAVSGRLLHVAGEQRAERQVLREPGDESEILPRMRDREPLAVTPARLGDRPVRKLDVAVVVQRTHEHVVVAALAGRRPRTREVLTRFIGATENAERKRIDPFEARHRRGGVGARAEAVRAFEMFERLGGAAAHGEQACGHRLGVEALRRVLVTQLLDDVQRFAQALVVTALIREQIRLPQCQPRSFRPGRELGDRLAEPLDGAGDVAVCVQRFGGFLGKHRALVGIGGNLERTQVMARRVRVCEDAEREIAGALVPTDAVLDVAREPRVLGDRGDVERVLLAEHFRDARVQRERLRAEELARRWPRA